ncbi:hypothetical protein [Thorsellia anophelis]|uniref:Uncharacterized protein n=1 Tax=Thorsellia anophelis DSM 18579 TaxID=1123402 RepID=A0A1H9Y2Z7_9GAMM|nr:hypothetical protein [Thorsellia anophelis]SES63180.1 hypothetical protein SAMN02583745_00023 [Thorsellia anophelis DSM 18579]
MDIIIKQPIHIAFETIEFDNHLPSVKFNILIRIDKFTYSCNIKTALWFECEQLDEFMVLLNKRQLASIRDMSNDFQLVLDPKSHTLKWLFRGDNVDSSIMNVSGSEKLTLDMYSHIYEAFNHYPKWW